MRANIVVYLAPSLIEFAKHNKTDPYFAFPESTDYLCSLLDAIGALIPGGIGGLLTSGGSLPSNLTDLLPANVSLCSPLS
jgi:hypothetical protein